MGTCSTCGKITTTKGEKGDPGAQGPQGEQGPAGEVSFEYVYTLGSSSYVYNGGAGTNFEFGTSAAVGEVIDYTGFAYVRALSQDTITVTPYGPLSHEQAYISNMPANIGADTYTYLTIPLNGKMTITGGVGTSFGVNINSGSGPTEVELMQLNVNFTRS